MSKHVSAPAPSTESCSGPPVPVDRARSRRVARRLVALLGVVALPACSTAPVLPPAPATVGVRMDEYRFVLDGSVPAGRVILTARNVGKIEHELDLISIPEDFPLTIGEQVRGSVRQTFPTKAIIPPRPAGGRGEFAVDLVPGRYALVCFVKAADGESHAVKGMTAEVRVH